MQQTQSRTIVITATDQQRLRDLLREARIDGSEDRAYLDALAKELDQAEVVPPDQIPPDVVTMNSKVRVSVAGSKRGMTFTLVYPQDADFDEDRISVLAPIGTALLGYRVGDEVEWDVPAGRRRYRIEKIEYQPEAAGDFDR